MSVATQPYLADCRLTMQRLMTAADAPDTDPESRVCRTPFPRAPETDGTT